MQARSIRVDALIAVGVALVVSGPMLFTRSGFAEDFTNSMWMVWVSGKSLVQAGHPGFFINTSTLGVFYPVFAFYGGPLYVYSGALSELLGGNAEAAFVAVTILTILAVYGSIVWLGRELGLRGLIAHAPALVAVTSAYYMTNLYGRGDWTEFMVTSSLAPLVASGVHLVRAQRWRPLPMAIFVASVVLLTAGHNITLLWGTTVGVGVLLLMWIAQGAPRSLPYRRMAMLVGLAAGGVLINAWFLLPDITYAAKVAVAHSEATSTAIWSTLKGFNLPGNVLNPLRSVPGESTTPALYVQAPVWFLAWALLAAALLLWRPAVESGLRRAWIATTVIVAVLLGMIMVKAFWRFVYYPFNEIQMPYRLATYVFYMTAGLVLAAGLALQRVADREGPPKTVAGLRVALAGAVAVSLALCMWQLWVPNTRFNGSYADRSAALLSATVAPNSWYAVNDYSDWQARIVPVPPGRVLPIPPSAVQGDRFEAWMNVPPGPQPIQTNIAGGSYLVRIGGLRLVGRNREDLAIVKRVGGGSGPVHVVIETAHGMAITLGRIVSAVAFFAVLAVLGLAHVRTRQVRRSSRVAVRAPAGG